MNLERMENINSLTADGWTPLQLAVNRNHIDILKLLLSREDLNINEVTHKGTALHLACKNNKHDII